MFSDFTLNGQWFTAMDGSSKMHAFNFTEATSFMIICDTQEEIDYYWEKLSAVPESEQCGWLKDKFGVSWQVVPAHMEEMMREGTSEQMKRVTEAFLAMKKFDIAALESAYHIMVKKQNPRRLGGDFACPSLGQPTVQWYNTHVNLIFFQRVPRIPSIRLWSSGLCRSSHRCSA